MIADLSGRSALVTGGGQGIGRGIALKLAEQGADVAIADINEEGAAAVVDEIKRIGRESFAVQIDVTDNESVVSSIGGVISRFGHLDILINNAGIGRVEGKAGGGLDEDWGENWNTVMDINVQGVMRCTKAVVGHFMARKYGKIVNTASGAGRGPIWWGTTFGCSWLCERLRALQSGGHQLHAVLRFDTGSAQHQRECDLPGARMDRIPRCGDFGKDAERSVACRERPARRIQRRCSEPNSPCSVSDARGDRDTGGVPRVR